MSFAACNLLAAPAPGDVRVYQVKGQPAEIILKDGTKPPIRVGESVPHDATIRTPASSTITLIFSNGATMAIQPGSELQVSFLTSDPGCAAMPPVPKNAAGHAVSDTDVKLKEGLIILDVPPQNSRSNFQVTTPLGIACIRGTQYFVQAGKKLAIVGVVTGKVLVKSLAGDSRLLTPGSVVALSPTGFLEAGQSGSSLLQQTLNVLRLLNLGNHSGNTAPSTSPASRASYNLSE